MNQKNLSQLNWRNICALAIGLGAIICIDTPATATPVKHHLQLAQVGVRSRVTPPTPLNLRPRVHTPLPQSNYSHYPRYSYPKYNTGYGNYCSGDCHHHHTHHNRHRRQGKVIIISPGNYNSVSNYSNSKFIRVIRN